MKKLKALALSTTIALTACSTTTPSFMSKAVVGTVDGYRTTVMFPNPNGTYRPQFTSDCPPALLGEDRPSTGGCVITPERVTNVEPYLVHKAHGAHANPRKPINADHTNYSNMINTTTDNL